MAFTFSKNISYIIIADHVYHDTLLKYKKTHSDIRFKLMTPTGFISSFVTFDIDETISYLISKEHLNYKSAKDMLKVLPFIDENGTSKYCLLKKRIIENGLFKYDPFGKQLLVGKEIINFELKNNVDIQTFEKSLGISAVNLELLELYIFSQKDLICYAFKNSTFMFNYVFSDIRAKIINKELNVDDIVVLCDVQSYNLQLEFFANLYKLPIHLKKQTLLFSYPTVQDYLQKCYDSKTIETFVTNEPYMSEVMSLIRRYSLNVFKDFNEGFARLSEILKNNSLEIETGNGIEVTNEISFNDSKHYYVLNFQYGDFYKIFDDSNYLFDYELSELNLNTSFNNTKQDEVKKKNFIFFNNIQFLSFAMAHLVDKIYKSQFIDELHIPLMFVNESNENGIYTTEGRLFTDCLYRDKGKLKATEYYKSYNNEFTNSKVKGIVTKFSPSAFNSYVECHFKYYLDNIVKVNDPDDKYAASLGTLLHGVLEKFYSEDFNYEKVFEDMVNEQFPNIDPRTRLFMDVIKDNFKNTISFLALQQEKVKFLKQPLTEKFETMYIQSKTIPGNEYKINGQVDKVLFTGDADHKYFTIVDYKSGNNDYIIPKLFKIGYSLQLPLYMMFLNKDFKEIYRPGGIFLQKIYQQPKVKDAGTFITEQDYYKNIKLHGLCVSDIKYSETFDAERITKKHSVGPYGAFTGAASNHEIFFTLNSNELDSTHLQDYYFYIEDGALNVMDSIYSGDFSIQPFSAKNGINPCKFCNYHDICFSDKNLYTISDVSDDEEDESENE